MIVLCKLVQHTNAVYHSVVLANLDDSCYGLCIKSVAGKALDEFTFLKVKAINLVTLFLEVKANGMACHTVTAAYKEFHIAIRFNYSERISFA